MKKQISKNVMLLSIGLIAFLKPSTAVHSQTGGGYICGQWNDNGPGRFGGWWFTPYGTKNEDWWGRTFMMSNPFGNLKDGQYMKIWTPTFMTESAKEALSYDPSLQVLVSIGSYDLVSNCLTPITPTPTPDRNTRQIWFSVKGGMVHSVIIRGINQNNVLKTYPLRTWNTGTPVVQIKGWWWKDYVAIDFTYKTTKTEKGRCVIDSLKMSTNADYTMIQYDPVRRTCSGDAGSAASIQELDALAYAILHKDNLGIFEDIISKYGAYSCGFKFLRALASRDLKIILDKPDPLLCPQQVLDYLIDLAPKYNKQVSTSTSSLQPYFTAQESMVCREGPSILYPKPWQLNPDEKVPVLGKWHEDSSWILVDINSSKTRTI